MGTQKSPHTTPAVHGGLFTVVVVVRACLCVFRYGDLWVCFTVILQLPCTLSICFPALSCPPPSALPLSGSLGAREHQRNQPTTSEKKNEASGTEGVGVGGLIGGWEGEGG